MKTVFHKASTRGHADHEWLISRHSFSFADYYDPARMGFGLLRVLNDDIVQPSMGFETHPHSNMEIISIPLSGTLRHKDSMGHSQIITTGEVQIMSAGSGVSHSEFNHSSHEKVNFLQIWIQPKEQDIQPRYAQKRYSLEKHKNHFYTLIAPGQSEESIIINQDAWLSMALLEEGSITKYTKQKEGNGLYYFLIEGQVEIGQNILNARDGMGITEAREIKIIAQKTARILCIDVPMSLCTVQGD